MHFAHSPHASSSKSTKIALVVAFHVILGIGLVKTMNVKLLALPTLAPPVTIIPTIEPPVVLPPPSSLPVPPLAAPTIVVPMPEVAVTAPPLPATVTTRSSEVVAPTEPPGRAIAPPAHPGAGSTGVAAVRTAAMIDGCAKPAYPAQAARNGDSGTVTLALLVGVDGRVSGSRIERSSGFRDLDKAAATALSLCTFKPAMQGDVAQAGWTQIAYVWTLE